LIQGYAEPVAGEDLLSLLAHQTAGTSAPN